MSQVTQGWTCRNASEAGSWLSLLRRLLVGEDVRTGSYQVERTDLHMNMPSGMYPGISRLLRTVNSYLI